MCQLSGVKILVVDDDNINLEIAGEYLKEMGASVVLQNDSNQVTNQLEQNEFNLVISDIEMPNKNGFQLIEDVRSKKHFDSIPFVAFTGYSGEELEKVTKAGFVASIAKPVILEQLKQVLSGVLKLDLKTEKSGDEQIINHKEIDGLEIGPALKRLRGNWPMLERLILSFKDNLKNEKDVIRDCFKNSLWSELERVSHKIRGTSGNIGAMALSDAAANVERKLKHKETLEAELVDQLCLEIDSVIKAGELLEVKEEQKQNISLANEVDSDQVIRVAKELVDSLDEDLGVADEKIVELTELVSGSRYEKWVAEANYLFNQFKLKELKSHLGQPLKMGES